MSFQTIDYEIINNWFNNSNECIVVIDYHSMMRINGFQVGKLNATE